MTGNHIRALGLVALFFVSYPSANAQSADIERAVAAYNSGDYATAIALFEPNAHQGNRDAQYAMGVAYYEGNGVNRDLDEALAWFRKAADSGHPTAMFNLGVAHWQGRGVEKSFAKAVDWWERAAELSDIPSQYNLGLAYYRGTGAEKDPAKAREWLGKAAAQGHADATRVLAMLDEDQATAQGTASSAPAVSSSTPATTAEAPASAVVNVNFRAAQVAYDQLAIRTGPAGSASLAGSLKQGTPVKITQTSDGWAKIETPVAPRFWVFGTYVDGSPSGRINADKVRLRSSPTTGADSSIVAQLDQGAAVIVHASSGDWKQVSAAQLIPSWVQLSGLAEQNPVTQSWMDNFNALSGSGSSGASPTQATAPSASTQAFKAAWTIGDDVAVHGRPAADSPLLNYLNKETPLKVMGSKGEWLMIQPSGGIDVWVYGEFVTENGARAQINNDRVRIRSLPTSASGSDVLGLLDRGAQVEVVSRKEGWVRVRVLHSVAGWIRKEQATVPGAISDGWQERWDALRTQAANG